MQPRPSPLHLLTCAVALLLPALGGCRSDAGSPPSGAAAADASAPDDSGGPVPDAGGPTDAGPRPDAAPPADAQANADAALPPDLGPPSPGSSVHALFGAGDERTLPFPNDIFTVDDQDTPTGRRLDLQAPHTTLFADRGTEVLFGADKLFGWLDQLDGFSVTADLLLGLDGELDPTSLPATAAASTLPDSPVFLLDVQPGSAHRGERLPVRVAAERFDDRTAGEVRLLDARPDLPLRPGNRYALVVRSTVRAVDGTPLGRSRDFEVAAGLRGLPDDPAAALRLARARTQLAPVLELLAAAAPRLGPRELAVVSVFTTQSATALLGGVRELLHGPDAPPLALELDPDGDGRPDLLRPEEVPGAPADAGDLTGIGAVLRGTFAAPEFRGAADGFHVGPDGRPVVAGTRTIPFLLALPDDPAAQPFPLVVLQHGHGARKEFLLYLAGFFARQGMATVAIDAVAHGELAEPRPFLDLPDVARIRDNFLQTAANQLRLVQALDALGSLDLVPAGAGDGQPDLDLSRPLGYVGESLGGIAGPLAVGLEPRFGAVIVNEAGGGLGLMVDSLVGAQAAQAAPRLALLEFTVLIQTFADRMDPLAYAPLLGAERPGGGGPAQLLVQAAWESEFMLGGAPQRLAYALGAPLVCPCPAHVETLVGLPQRPAPVDSPGLFCFDPALHGFLLANPKHPESTLAARLQATRFFRSFFDGGVGQVADPATLNDRN